MKQSVLIQDVDTLIFYVCEDQTMAVLVTPIGVKGRMYTGVSLLR